MSMKNSSDTIGNRTHDLSACTTVERKYVVGFINHHAVPTEPVCVCVCVCACVRVLAWVGGCDYI
jgi:hypothetical protein